MQASGQAMNGGPNAVSGQQQSQQRQDHTLPLPDLAQPSPVDQALSPMQQPQQPQPQPAPLSFQDQQQQLQAAVCQVQDLCQRINTPWLSSLISEIDAVVMHNQLGAIEECARIAKDAVRNVFIQYPSSPPAQRLSQQVSHNPLVRAVSGSMVLTRWPRHEQVTMQSTEMWHIIISAQKVHTSFSVHRTRPFSSAAVFPIFCSVEYHTNLQLQ